MPDYFSHYICAEKIFEKLDAQTRALIPNRNLYLLGAQGGDVFFAYSVKFSRSNPGRDLHVKNPAELFCLLGGLRTMLSTALCTLRFTRWKRKRNLLWDTRK